MNTLTQQVQAFHELIEKGDTLQAMELYYADAVTLHENDEPLRVGKSACMAHEKKLLTQVSDLQIKVLHQAIDLVAEVVFSELDLFFVNGKGEKQRLHEVSVQHWQNGQIVKEQFFYKAFMTVD